MFNSPTTTFYKLNTIEGYSYLFLVFVAMPLKYILGFAIAVKIAGMVHGVLFVLFCYFLFLAWRSAKWPFRENIIFFIASLIPFGTMFTASKALRYVTEKDQ